MSTPEAIKQLVKEISSLSSSLSDAVLKGSKDDKIWSVLNSREGDTPHETFNRRSRGGITISKRCSCLKGDIVEALQCIKCAIWHGLLFREPAPSSISEAEETCGEEPEAGGDSGGVDESDVEEVISWDGLLGIVTGRVNLCGKRVGYGRVRVRVGLPLPIRNPYPVHG
jgi:hypothetical protein